MAALWAPHRRLDVLWIEDDRAFAAAAREFFRLEETAAREVLPWHVNLHHVETLADAKSDVAVAPPSIIVADLNLPDSSGADTIEALRRMMPSIPLVILSGEADVAIGLATGINNAEFLSKDRLTPDALWRTILAALSRQHGAPQGHPDTFNRQRTS